MCPDHGAIDHVGGAIATRHFRQRFEHRTRRSRPIVGSVETRCSTCHIRPAGAATAHPSAPSTSSLRNTAGCLEKDGIPDLAPTAKAGQLTTTPRPIRQSARPTLPPKDSLESTPESQVKLCPRNLAKVLRSGREATRTEDGCLDYEFALDEKDTGTVLVYERWRDQAALETHLAAPATAELLGAWADKIKLRVSKFDASNERRFTD